MATWIPYFVIVASIAIVIQAVVLCAQFIQIRRMAQRIESVTTDLQTRVRPLVSRIQTIVDEAQPKISSMITDAAEITSVAKGQVQRADRVLTEALERVRLQLIHADQILTGALETVEDAGAKVRRTVWGPVQSVAAVVRGIQVGLEFYRGRRRPSDGVAAEQQQDEGMFI